MSEFETGYQAIPSFYDDDTDEPVTLEDDVMIHVVPESGKARWNHIENLDEFFSRVYQFHQRHGFWCMVLEDILQLLQFVFVVTFTVFLIDCVKYDVLFHDIHYNGTHKVTINESLYSLDQCVHNIQPGVAMCMVVAGVFWLLRLLKVVYNIYKYSEIKAFYTLALRISSSDLPNLTWHEVQKRVLDVQKEQQMCIHKAELTELDIYQRILRFKNYMIAMVNKSLLPLKFQVPFVGEWAYLSTSLKYNLEMILFWGPWSPFDNYWHLNPDYKNSHKRKELADKLSSTILWVGLANLLLSPVIFLWQILYFFFMYASVLRKEPGILGLRRWSLYARQYLRHFNELDHEFNARMNRAYRASSKYMDIFTSPAIVVLAKNGAFFGGSVLAVLVILTVYDEDVLQVEHILSTITLLGLFVTVCRNLIPNEHMVWCPELCMKTILAQIHYMPDSWKGHEHMYRVRDEFAQLFQYKFIYLLEELFSPLLTPLILIFYIRHKSLDIVDFYRNFSVEVVGVGDVCSFAQMDIRKHGNPQWAKESQTEADNYTQAEDGKTELSLMHFTLTNPEWRPPNNCSIFINDVRQQAQRDANTLSIMPLDNPLWSSLHTMSSNGGGYNSYLSSVAHHSMMPSVQSPPGGQTPLGGTSQMFTSAGKSQSVMRGAISNAEGPMGGARLGILSSLHSINSSGESLAQPLSSFGHPDDHPSLEMVTAEMSVSALYMHELHRQRRNGPGYENLEDIRSRAMWRQDSEVTHPMPSIRENVEDSLNPEILESTEEEPFHDANDPQAMLLELRDLSKSS